MTRLRHFIALAFLLVFAASVASAATAPPVGLWYGTIFFGDPADPTVPKLQMAFTMHQDGTLLLDSTSETGEHPFLPGDKSVFHGVWKMRGRRVETRGFAFDEVGGGAGFSVLRGVAAMKFESRDVLSGWADFDFLPCPGGPLDCPDPSDGGFLELGEGAGPFPVVLRRFQ